MSIIEHRYVPLIGRTPGGSDYPLAVDEDFPALTTPPGATTVAVIDTGIVVDGAGSPHPWLADHVDFVPGTDVDELCVGVGGDAGTGRLAHADGHGTFVSGLILREVPSATIRMYGVIDRTNAEKPDGLEAEDDIAVGRALDDILARSDVSVVNLSFGGGQFPDDKTAATIGDKISQLIARGVAVVAAAGTVGGEERVYPAAFEGVISVGSLDGRLPVPPGAAPLPVAALGMGSWVRAYAPGVRVLGPYLTYAEPAGDPYGLRPRQEFAGWARWSGSSFASATVAGRIAQVLVDNGLTSGGEAATLLRDQSPVINKHSAWWIR